MYTAAKKADKVLQWAKDGWDFLNGYLKLNALLLDDYEAALVPVYSDLVVDDTEYLDGTAKRRFSFQLRIVTQWSDGYDDINARAMDLVSKWLDWVNAQFDDGNLPDFGNAIITGIESDQDMPSIDVTNPDEGKAEYVFFGRINYIE